MGTGGGVRAVRLFAELGNQMFQYAMLRGLDPDGGPVVIEDSTGNIELLRRAVRSEEIRTLTPAEARALRRAPLWTPRRRVQDILDWLKPKPIRSLLDARIHREPGWGVFDPGVSACEPPVLYAGFFQREEYFLHAADRVVDGFRPVSDVAVDAFREASQSMSGRSVVSVQLRTGADYVAWAWTPHYDWFRSAAELVAERAGEVGFVIVSDVPLAASAVAASLDDLGPARVLPPVPAYDAIRAQGLADHAVLSPSSFAWWGAWFGDHRSSFDGSRVVVAPRPWIQDEMQPASQRWVLLDQPPRPTVVPRDSRWGGAQQ